MRAGSSGWAPGSGALGLRRRAGLVELIALVLALDERQALLPSERRARDLEAARALDGRTGVELLRHWLGVAPSPALARRVRRVARALAWLRDGISLLGFVFGWSAAAALLAIGGPQGRISIAACLGVLVGLPLASWLASSVLFLFSLLVSPLGARSSGAAGGGRGRLSAGLWRLGLRLVPASIRVDAEAVLGRARAQAGLYARVQRGQMMSWLGRAGLCFGLGALAATLGFVVFTDLAFGWSTTLDVAPERVHRFVAAVARPWARLWPEASPSLELVAATRHFRVEALATERGLPPIVYGAWWPFLVMAIGCYAVLPRLALLLVLAPWLGREVERAMSLTPGVLELVESLTTPRVETRAEGEEGPIGRALAGMVPEVGLSSWLARAPGGASGPPVAIVWAEAVDAGRLRGRLAGDLQLLEAGGRRTLDDDAAAVRAASASEQGVFVAVRGHEPPVLEQLDFIADLRRATGAARPLAVVLIGGGAVEHSTWRRKLASLADPGLVVAKLEVEDD